MAGFGARRFMQDMYQQQSYPQQSRDQHHHYHHHHHQPSHSSTDASYRRNQDRHAHAPVQANTSASYHQSPPTQLNALPATTSTSSSYSHHTVAAQMPRYPQQLRHEVRYAQSGHNHQTRAAGDDAAADPRKGATSAAVWRSDSLDSSATDSTAGLAYERSGDSNYSINQQSNSVETAVPNTRAQIPQIRLEDRATIYDDDYEEPAAFPTADPMDDPANPSHPPAGALLDDVSADASFRIVRATVLEPDLPKAKCADCGEQLDFEELASHTCQPSSAVRPPLLTIQLPASSSDSSVSSGATSSALNTPRSPFFDRYDSLVNDSRPMTPVVFATASHTDARRGEDQDDATPKAHAVRVVGMQAAFKVSSSKATCPPAHGDVSPPLQPPSVQRSASDTQADAAARRKMIEEQRAAKVKHTMTSPIPRAATTSSLVQQSILTEDLSRSASVGASPSAVRTAKAVSPTTSKPRLAESLSSPDADSFEQSGPSAKGSGTSTRASPSPTTSKLPRERGHVDLSSIEEMMKDLTASPEPLKRTLVDSPQKLGQKGTVAADASQRPRAATTGERSDRERLLELELERMRDRERTRQLQVLRFKEKKRRERAAKRCCVCDCSLSSSRTPFVERDGKLLCARDWKELYLPKCRKCNLIVEKGAVKSSDGALRGVFHRSCFSCAACEAPFTDGSFYVFNNQPYCSRHYHRLNGSLCRECETGIEGDCRQTDAGDRFHPACFCCQYSSSKRGACAEALAEYYVVGGQRLCERHADKVSRKLVRAGQKQVDLRAQKRMTMLHSLR
ncbi:Paxillin-like protein 1 [Pseudozyma hubeiensis]|nr:Paxillin-like protein 1 [Pseudozyma hubeiensis]